MSDAVRFSAVPAGLAETLASKGFDQLTPIQEAVLSPELAGRDLRIASKTGSGKTVAVGMALAPELEGLAPTSGSPAAPQVLLIAPTRELAAQLGRELEWLYAALRVRLAVVTGGSSISGDFRALRAGPHVLIGTPGRLTDHLRRGSIDLGAVRAVVLDEADEMLDMGFRDDLELLLGETPDERRTHMVSATFSREALRLARRYQRDPAEVEGERGGAANADIAHVGVVVPVRERLAALINILLLEPSERTLVFVRTRAATAALAADLVAHGFAASPLSGEMGQRERTAALEAFRAGNVRCLVATDVAARGLDIQDVTRVVHFELPENPEVFTHRSGRTGRAGNEGTSILFVPPSARRRAEAIFGRAGVDVCWRPAPSPEDIRRRADERLVSEVEGAEVTDDRHRELAAKLLASADDPAEVVAALLARSDHAGPCEPREVRAAPERPERSERAPRSGPPHRDRHRGDGFVRFHVSWGANHGANKSRLLAMVCRRGGVRGDRIGAIRVGPFRSVVEVSRDAADDFARATRRPDPRNPNVVIRPWNDAAGAGHRARRAQS